LIQKVKSSKNLDYTIFVTGMHMLQKYGSTLDEISKSGFDQIYSFINQDDIMGAQMDYVTANTINGLGLYVREFRPDLIVVHGDRTEALAGAIVGVLNNILVAHIEGGEVSGTVDGLIRHAITKLSHIHFTTNKMAKDRLIQMGEESSNIYVIGSPEIDVLLSKKLPKIEEVKKYYQIDFSNYGIFIYHPVTSEINNTRENISNVIDSIIESKLNYVVIYPNNDAGSDIIFNEITRLQNLNKFRLLPSMRFESYVTLMKNANFIIGNSSSGVREAPVFGLPTINIGTRQMNRNKSKSIVNVNENKKEISYAIKNLQSKIKPTSKFGYGKSAEKFIKILNSSNFWKISIQKDFVDKN
tara:strand:+ start:47868 stop:48935 length:1068 start_codon:yes stop_codon:yes gene_type:complete